MESVPFPDNGGRRRVADRRKTAISDYSPERRSKKERRDLADRRETPRM